MNQKLIELVKLKGRLIKFEIVELKNDKYCQLVLMLYIKEYYIIQTILDNHKDVCHYEDGEKITYKEQVLKRFDQIIEDYKKNDHEN